MTVHLAPARAPRACAALLALLLPYSGAVFGATITVGTGGDHATIQAALGAANAAAGDDEIRIRSGTYTETVELFTFVDEGFELSGGWDASFEIQTEDPALTVIDAVDAGRALDIDITDGTLVVRNLTFTRGAATGGAGVQLSSRGDADVSLTDCVIHHSTAFNTVSVSDGGGGALVAFDTSRLEIVRCAVHDNRSESTATVASAGGLSVASLNDARLVLRELNVFDNAVVSDARAFAGGVGVRALHASHVTLVDSNIEGNSIDGGNSESGSGVNLVQGPTASTNARIEFRRNRVVGNTCNITDDIFRSYQMTAQANNSGGIVIGDSLIADGIGCNGFEMSRFNDATFEIVNITSAGHSAIDLKTFGGASVANSLAGLSQLGLDTVLANNLLDADPGYVNPANGDYHLLLTSPAIGAGTLTPPGGLGPNDLDGKARRIGLGVDLGAFEADDPVVYIDGFE